jgi:hypothetical protein
MNQKVNEPLCGSSCVDPEVVSKFADGAGPGLGCGVGRNLTANESLEASANSFKNETTTRKPKSGPFRKVQGVVDSSMGGRARPKLAESNDVV